MDVAVLIRPGHRRSRLIGEAMVQGIHAAGDTVRVNAPKADVVVSYGWKRQAEYRRYPAFVYADLGYWERENYHRFSVNDWSPHRYVRRSLPAERFERLGLRVKPWRQAGREIVVAGHSFKSAQDHGMQYQAWERAVIAQLQGLGLEVVYRPKPNDPFAQDIAGVRTDRRPISEALEAAHAWVTHHSNSAVDALLAGVPVHCETGAAAAFSVPLEDIADPPLLEGREQFLADVAWLQWTFDEMRSGECWRHLRELL